MSWFAFENRNEVHFWPIGRQISNEKLIKNANDGKLLILGNSSVIAKYKNFGLKLSHIYSLTTSPSWTSPVSVSGFGSSLVSLSDPFGSSFPSDSFVPSGPGF